jgi:hypothetical protein
MYYCKIVKNYILSSVFIEKRSSRRSFEQKKRLSTIVWWCFCVFGTARESIELSSPLPDALSHNTEPSYLFWPPGKSFTTSSYTTMFFFKATRVVKSFFSKIDSVVFSITQLLTPLTFDLKVSMTPLMLDQLCQQHRSVLWTFQFI